jgi:hypothetical protein
LIQTLSLPSGRVLSEQLNSGSDGDGSENVFSDVFQIGSVNSYFEVYVTGIGSIPGQMCN